MIISCAKCGTALSVPEGVEACACPSCGQTIDLSALSKATCPICCSPFEEEDNVIQCPDCQTWHHVECWNDNHGCSTYGCASSAAQDVHAEDAAAAVAAEGGAPSVCPSCHQPIGPDDLVCPHCGMLTSEKLQSGLSKEECLGQLGRLKRNLVLFFKDLAGIVQRTAPPFWTGYGNAFRKYAVFKGRTSRGDLVRFRIVDFVLLFLLARFEKADLLVGLYWAATPLPILALTIRRLRDTDISPWFIFAIPVLPLLLLTPTVLPGGREAGESQAPESEVP